MGKVYTDEERLFLAGEVCEIVANGKSTKNACEQAGVRLDTFLRWCSNYDEIDALHTRARNSLVEHWASEIVDIAEEEPDMYVDKNGATRIDPNSIQQKKLQIDSRKWIISKLNPQRYGERLQHANDPDNPMPAGAVVQMVSKEDESL